MGNSIDFKEDYIQCSNGLTNVLLTTIGLSGSKYAVDEDEKNLIVWMMTCDQNRRGIGTVSFDLRELPWKKEKFQQQKTFLLKVLDGVKNKIGWEVLDYTPNEDILFGRIYGLKKMIEKMTVEDIDENSTLKWLKEDEMILKGYPKCKKHNIFLSIYGCMACNDEY